MLRGMTDKQSKSHQAVKELLCYAGEEKLSSTQFVSLAGLQNYMDMKQINRSKAFQFY